MIIAELDQEVLDHLQKSTPEYYPYEIEPEPEKNETEASGICRWPECSGAATRGKVYCGKHLRSNKNNPVVH